ncbi:MAG: CDP-diacylglycerol--glycerol-3-phosphate 3-phosphatidyltransferase [Candidatus Muiribacteriota bacterium]
MNIADKFTFFRLLVVPFFIFFYMFNTGGEGLEGDFLKIFAAFLFILGAISDGMDGYYARKYKLVTNRGKLWDPVADKILVCSALIILSHDNFIPPWTVIIIVSREFFVTAFRLVALEKGRLLAASKTGKWKTGFQLAYIITILVFISFEVLILSFNYKSAWTDLFILHNKYIFFILEYLTIFFTIYSGYDYYRLNRDIL